MQLCERFPKALLLAGLIGATLIYVFFAISCDPILDSWSRLEKFSMSSKKAFDSISPLPKPVTKKILFWDTMFGDETFYFGRGDLFKNCPGVGKNCWATHERSPVAVEDFDAVLFHGAELRVHDVPKNRRSRQYYVFVNLESPSNRPLLYSYFEDNFFNLTMTYRLDSDIVWPYADIRNVENGNYMAPKIDTVWKNMAHQDSTDMRNTITQKTTETWANSGPINKRRNKSRTAVWFVSNCQSQSGREKYVSELAMHVDVDIYGLCGKEIRCPTNRDCFREVVEPEYYFYLSFENSLCQDYVTEKLYNPLKYDVVPIVYGGANYSLFAPPGSYINALDFNSPRELASYLKRLIARPEEYDKYFEWKKSYRVATSNSRVICQLCQYLHEHSDAKSYSPLSTWYHSDKCPLQEVLKYLPYATKKNLKNR